MSVHKVVAMRCDWCRKTVAGADDNEPDADQLRTWWRLEAQVGDEVKDFCCAKCLQKFAECIEERS